MCDFLQRVHLNIQVGEHAVDYQQIVAKDKLNDLQLRMRQLMDQVEQINKEQAYQRVSHQCYFWWALNRISKLSIVVRGYLVLYNAWPGGGFRVFHWFPQNCPFKFAVIRRHNYGSMLYKVCYAIE